MALPVLGEALLAIAAAYPLVALVAVWLRHRRERSRPPAAGPGPISVLKPLCGDEPRLYENLRSFCEQDFADDYQIVLGARHAGDPALRTARRLQREFPQRDIVVVADERLHGSNLKVSNLINLLGHARHDTLVLADSDMRVPRDYLRRVTAPLARRGVGMVTCLYRGQPVAGLWSRLGALFVNEWFAPSVSVAQMSGPTFFAFGATIAMRRATLESIGGLAAVADHLADDYCLAQLTREHGLRVVLSDCEVTSDVVEPGFAHLVAHELRWLRTIRSVQLAGYLGSLATFTVPVALASFALTAGGPLATSLFVTALIGRLSLHFQSARRASPPTGLRQRTADLLLVLVSDWLSLALWAIALNTRRVNWRGQTLMIDARGSALLVPGGTP